MKRQKSGILLRILGWGTFIVVLSFFFACRHMFLALLSQPSQLDSLVIATKGKTETYKTATNLRIFKPHKDEINQTTYLSPKASSSKVLPKATTEEDSHNKINRPPPRKLSTNIRQQREDQGQSFHHVLEERVDYPVYSNLFEVINNWNPDNPEVTRSWVWL